MKVKPRRAVYGRQSVCIVCDSDVEWHGREHGWIDRGSNTHCDTSGACRRDENGVKVPYPHIVHRGTF